MIIKLADDASLEYVENVWYFCRGGKQVRSLNKFEDDFVSAAWAAGYEAASAGYRVSIGVSNDELDDLKRKLSIPAYETLSTDLGKSIDDLVAENKRLTALAEASAAPGVKIQRDLLNSLYASIYEDARTDLLKKLQP